MVVGASAQVRGRQRRPEPLPQRERWAVCRQRDSSKNYPALAGPVQRNEAMGAMPVEHEYRMRSDQVSLAHQNQIPIVENPPLAVDARRQHGMVLVADEIAKHDDLHIVT